MKKLKKIISKIIDLFVRRVVWLNNQTNLRTVYTSLSRDEGTLVGGYYGIY